jgi:hypothetical protein
LRIIFPVCSEFQWWPSLSLPWTPRLLEPCQLMNSLSLNLSHQSHFKRIPFQRPVFSRYTRPHHQYQLPGL